MRIFFDVILIQLRSNRVNLGAFLSFFAVIQIKGFKALTHSQDTTLSDCFKNSIEKMKRGFPTLDWDNLMDRRQGELYYDVGVTVQPRTDKQNPLTGLWRLDSLEASLGASGFSSGQLHTINTMSLCGGVQAEMLPQRKWRTHISFVSAYNLAWELIRPKNNERTLFEEKKVYQRSESFHEEVENVQKVLEDAEEKSLGLRYEIRVGGATLGSLGQILDGKVSKDELFLKSKI